MHSRHEIANSLTHGAGMVLSLVGLPPLVAVAAQARGGDAWHVLGCALFGLSMVAMFGASTFYHGARCPQRRARLQVIDHVTIYLLIAGTYTPFCLAPLRGPWGFGLLTAAWAVALAGSWLKLQHAGRFPRLSTLGYLGMGWMCLVALEPLVERLPAECLWLVAVGGGAYTFGTLFFVLDRRPWFHTVWHGFVLTGAGCLYAAVLGYIAPHAG